jgi:hypothetical protein
VVELDFCPDLSAVVQDDEGGRDNRTEPGVSTPGAIKKRTAPKAAVERLPPTIGDIPKQTVHQNIFRPFRACLGLGMFLGLEPRLSPIVPSGQKPQNSAHRSTPHQSREVINSR